jgi:hypothetical protein
MYNPLSPDYYNEEMSVTGINQLTSVVELHPISGDISGDIQPITVADFCKHHGITSDQFLSLRRKAARKNPGIAFEPIREGSRTYWVQHIGILDQLVADGAVDITEQVDETPDSSEQDDETPDTVEAINGELVDETVLDNGSKLTVRTQQFQMLEDYQPTAKHEVTIQDVSDLTAFNLSCEADREAKEKVKRLTDLLQFASAEYKEKEQKRAIANYISQGKTPEQAVRLAMGI